MDLPRDKLIHARKYLQFTTCLFADVQNIPSSLRPRAGDRKIDLVDLILFDVWENVLSSAHNGHVIQIPPPLIGVVVDDAAYLVRDVR